MMGCTSALHFFFPWSQVSEYFVCRVLNSSPSDESRSEVEASMSIVDEPGSAGAIESSAVE